MRFTCTRARCSLVLLHADVAKFGGYHHGPCKVLFVHFDVDAVATVEISILEWRLRPLCDLIDFKLNQRGPCLDLADYVVSLTDDYLRLFWSSEHF